MPTSTSSPSTSTQFGKCVVCGEETHLKCSDCARNGIDWMYFCSIDHKKLIWFTHKRVCGVNANPFRLPGFDDSEWNAIMDHLPNEGETRDPRKQLLISTCKDHVDRSICRASCKDAAIDLTKQRAIQLFGHLRDRRRASRNFTNWTVGQAADLYIFRLLVHNQALRSGGDSVRVFSKAELHDATFSRLAAKMHTLLWPEFPPHLPFYTELHHRYLIYATFYAIPNVPMEFVSHSTEELSRIFKEIGRTHPVIAENLSKGLRKDFFQSTEEGVSALAEELQGTPSPWSRS
ncbi:hypothetical protein JCM3765_007790 [Sporobolomyces pararoseus]